MAEGSDVNRTNRVILVAHTLIWDASGSELLLLERANTGVFDGYLALPGGRVKAGEPIADAAAREAREEVSIDTVSLAATCVLPFDGGVNFIFSCTEWRGEAANMEPNLCAGVGWYAVDRLPSKTVPWLSTVLAMQDSEQWFHDFTKTRSRPSLSSSEASD